MKLFVVILAALAVCHADLLNSVSESLMQSAVRAKWSNFKTTHNKAYAHAEESARLHNFLKTTQLIEEHNEKFAKGEETYEMGHNHFSDMTDAERASHCGGVLPEAGDNSTTVRAHPSTGVGAPASFDWRSYHGVLSPMRDQGQCGSCYTFAVTGVLESMFFRKFGREVDLSEQDLLDCAIPANGCSMNGQCPRGGNTGQTFNYAQRFGQMYEANYNYRGVTDGRCYHDASKTAFRANAFGYWQAPSNNVAQLREIIANYGPVAAHVLVDNGFQQYKGFHIYSSNTCANGSGHFVQIVGYGTENNVPYWIIKNSWNTYWGQNGYGRIASGYNMCNIENYNLYAQFN